MNDHHGTLQLVPGGDQFSKRQGARARRTRSLLPARAVLATLVPSGRASPLHGRGEEPRQEGEEVGRGPVPHGCWVLAASRNASHISSNTLIHLGG